MPPASRAALELIFTEGTLARRLLRRLGPEPNPATIAAAIASSVLASGKGGSSMAERQVILSCEHADNVVPDCWRGVFVGHEGLLATHRGYDIGILSFAERLAMPFGLPCMPAP